MQPPALPAFSLSAPATPPAPTAAAAKPSKPPAAPAARAFGAAPASGSGGLFGGPGAAPASGAGTLFGSAGSAPAFGGFGAAPAFSGFGAPAAPAGDQGASAWEPSMRCLDTSRVCGGVVRKRLLPVGELRTRHLLHRTDQPCTFPHTAPHAAPHTHTQVRRAGLSSCQPRASRAPSQATFTNWTAAGLGTTGIFRCPRRAVSLVSRA